MSAKPWLIVPLELTVADKTYVVQPVDYQSGIELLDVLQRKSKKIKADSPNEMLFRLVLGGVWDEMLADKLPFNVMFRAGVAAAEYQSAIVSDKPSETAVAQAEAVWESGIDPEALAAALASTATAATSPASRRSRSTASGNETRSPAPTSPTTSPTGTRRRSPKPKAQHPSAGTRSATSGR